MQNDFIGPARRATRADIEAAAATLRVDVATMRAVMEVESRNSGFDAKGRPVILFEPHVFYRNLPAGARRDRAVKAGLAYKAWRRGNYPTGSAIKRQDSNYARLAAAIEIDREAAYRAISIGLGQVLGENFKAAGYQSAEAMFLAARESEGVQLQQMANFIRANGLADELRRRDWAGFARRYNGPSYAKNRYDVLLARAYAKWTKILSKPRAELTAADLRAAGSRTVAAADEVKTGAIAAGLATASGVASQAQDIIAQVNDVAQGVKSGAGYLELLRTYWPLVVTVLAVLVGAYFIWRVWRGARKAEAARVDDARSGVNERRL